MEVIEIVLLITGLLIVIASFVIADKKAGDKESLPEFNFEERKKILLEEKEQLEIEIEKVLEDKKEEAIIKTDDELSHISNEKIMAMNEFSDQVLAKIEENHKEVVFLYNMLNEKETELKKLMQERRTTDSRREHKVVEMESKKEERSASKLVKMQEVKNKANQQAAVVKEKVKQMEAPKEEEVENNNDKILELYKDGKSVMEISKILNQGQGEVKLVVDLYQRSKSK